MGASRVVGAVKAVEGWAMRVEGSCVWGRLGGGGACIGAH